MRDNVTKKRFLLLSTMLTLLIFTTACTRLDDFAAATTAEAVATTEVTETVSSTYRATLEANVKAWGLGNKLIDYVSNDRAYDWYIDQAHTGTHSGANCGPSSVAMAAKWVDEDFDKTAEDARKKFRPLGGWWYGDDIEGCLDYFDVDYSVIFVENAYTLMSIFDSGKIAIVNNSMGYIPLVSDSSSRVNRFYSFDSGHYFIVKGYLKVDNKTYFEVYDPNNWDMFYEDGTEMGKNRYYEADVLLSSMTNWYPYAVMINP